MLVRKELQKDGGSGGAERMAKFAAEGRNLREVRNLRREGDAKFAGRGMGD